jgi:hypothetical protein
VSDDMEKKGPGKPSGGKDLDALKAKLGLGKTKSPTSPLGSKPKAAPQRDAKEDFKFSFGDVTTEKKPAFSAKELADIDAEANKAANPFGRIIIKTVGALVLVTLVLWLGYQFGSSMGMRIMHNEAVKQAQEIKGFFLKKYSNPAGDKIDPRRDITTRFVEDFDAYQEAHLAELMALGKLLENNKLPPDFNMKEFKEGELVELKTLCKAYLRNIEGYSVATILKGQLYGTGSPDKEGGAADECKKDCKTVPEVGAKLLEFADRTNKLRNRVESLYIAIELIENYDDSSGMPKGLKGEVRVHALQTGDAKNDLPVIAVVEIAKNAKPVRDNDVTNKDVCEPVSVEVEVPTCGGKDEPATEKRLIEAFDKTVVEVVSPFLKIKVNDADGKPITARIENLYKMDLKPYLKPLIDRIEGDRKLAHGNLAVLVGNLVQNMNDVRMAGDAVDFTELLDSLEKYATQETFYTF